MQTPASRQRPTRGTLRTYRVSVKPASAPAWHYTGLFFHGFDAVIDALARTVGQQVRISARVLP